MVGETYREKWIKGKAFSIHWFRGCLINGMLEKEWRPLLASTRRREGEKVASGVGLETIGGEGEVGDY